MSRLSKKLLLISTLLGALALSAAPAWADPVEPLAHCQDSTGPQDGGAPTSGALGFTADFFGTSATAVTVNEDGNITFDGARNDFAAVDLTTASDVMIAPLLADVDARPSDAFIKYGNGVLDDGTTHYFCVDWSNVAAWGGSGADRDTFQLLLTQSAAQAAHHDFTITFNYGALAWAGTGATAGFSAGNGVPGSAYAMAATTGLVSGSHGSAVPGRYVFAIVNRPIGGGRLSGMVYESDWATPALYQPVNICPAAGGPCTTRAANHVGEYVAAGLAPGVYDLSATSGADTGSTRVTITCGENVAPDLVLGQVMPPTAAPKPACPPPPAIGKPGTGGPTPSPSVRGVDARAALSAQLPALVRRIARRLAAGRRSFVVPFRAGGPGTATLAITRGHTRVALGRVTTTHAGALALRVKLTHKGRALLRRHSRLRLRLAISFAPRGGAIVRVARTFSLRPR